MKVRSLSRDNASFPTKDDFMKRQFTKGLPLSLVGVAAYPVVRLIGGKPKPFAGICRCFEIGKGWGGFSLGWYFVCSKDAPDAVRWHEIGHSVVNANAGGFAMLGFSIASAVRYWTKKVKNTAGKPYYSWWFERQASEIGEAYKAVLMSDKDAEDSIVL